MVSIFIVWCSRHCAKYFKYIISLYHHVRLVPWGRIYYLHFTNEEMRVREFKWLAQGPMVTKRQKFHRVWVFLLFLLSFDQIIDVKCKVSVKYELMSIVCPKLLGIGDRAINIHVLSESTFRGCSLTTIYIIKDIRLNLCLRFTGIMLLKSELTSQQYLHPMSNEKH